MAEPRYHVGLRHDGSIVVNAPGPAGLDLYCRPEQDAARALLAHDDLVAALRKATKQVRRREAILREKGWPEQAMHVGRIADRCDAALAKAGVT